MNSVPREIEERTRNNSLFRLSNCTTTTSPLVMFLKTTPGNKKLRHEGTSKCRWKVYLWQLPDDLVSWYLPLNDLSQAVNTLQSFGILTQILL